MRRTRFQKGSVRPRKHGRQKVWVAQWWDAGTKRSKVLGRCSEVSKGEAEALMSQILREHNDDAGHHQQPIFTFQQYVNDVFLPVYRKKWKESTRSTSEPDILRHLIPEFGKQRLEVINRNHMQRFLEQSAQVLSSSVVGHLRWHLNAIFKLAASDGAVSFNPAAALYIPACKASSEKRVMTKEEVRTALKASSMFGSA